MKFKIFLLVTTVSVILLAIIAIVIVQRERDKNALAFNLYKKNISNVYYDDKMQVLDGKVFAKFINDKSLRIDFQNDGKSELVIPEYSGGTSGLIKAHIFSDKDSLIASIDTYNGVLTTSGSELIITHSYLQETDYNCCAAVLLEDSYTVKDGAILKGLSKNTKVYTKDKIYINAEGINLDISKDFIDTNKNLIYKDIRVIPGIDQNYFDFERWPDEDGVLSFSLGDVNDLQIRFDFSAVGSQFSGYSGNRSKFEILNNQINAKFICVEIPSSDSEIYDANLDADGNLNLILCEWKSLDDKEWLGTVYFEFYDRTFVDAKSQLAVILSSIHGYQ